MRNIEVRRGVTDRWGEPEPAGDGIRKGIAGDGCRIVVHGFAPSVRTSELEPMAHPLPGLAQRMRPDVVTEKDQHELYQRNAPQVEAALYLVPKVIE